MLFSVAMCVWKGDDTELFTIASNSILSQSLLPNQIVLVVDGEVDDELNSKISCFEDEATILGITFTLFRFENNVGHGSARRKSLDLCLNDYVAICDADDLNVDIRFEKQMRFMENNPVISVVGGYIEEYSDFSSPLVKPLKRTVPTESEQIAEYSKTRCPMNQMSVMFKKEDIQAVGGYRDFYHNEDYYLWCRLLLAGKNMANIPEVLVKAAVSSATYERRGGKSYFVSEMKIQLFMLRNGMISVVRFGFNSIVRFILQIVITDKFRKLIFNRFLREK
ncbi:MULTISPECIES: glycosyltransferase [unclassified Vibrio]|uniref:glycosyltransferase n=1 Tax=unclassified Vibrio TaxID=2614977 RepID=UPI00354C9FC4